MNVYLITYDLPAPGQKYNCIKEKIEAKYPWWKCLNNIFIVKSNDTATQIHNYLSSCIDTNDKILVVKLDKDVAGQGFSDDCANWLNTALS